MSILSVAEARVPYQPKINSDFAFSLQLEDRDGHLWFTDPDQGFVEYDGKSWWLHQLPSQDHSRTRLMYDTIVKDHEGELYFKVMFYPYAKFSSHGYPVFYYLNRDVDLTPVLKSETIPCYTFQNPGDSIDSVNCELMFDKQNRLYLDLSKITSAPKQDLYILSDHYRLEGSRWISLLEKYQLLKHIHSYLGPILKENLFYLLRIDHENRLWFSFTSESSPTKSLLVLLDKQEKQHFYPERSLLLEDSHGNLWSSDQPQRGKTRLWQLNAGLVWIPAKSAPVPDSLDSLKEDHLGNLWAVTLKGDIYQQEHQSWKKMYSVSKPIRALAFDKNNQLWVSTGNEIIRYHQGQQTRWEEVLYPEKEADLHPGYGVISIFVDQQNTKWFQFSDDYMPGVERTYHKTPLKFDGRHWQYLWASPLLDQP